MLQRGMDTEQHPLISHLKSKGESLSGFAKRVKMSRMQLYRIMAGEGTTTSTIKQISEATGGAVSMSELLPKQVEAAQ